MASVNKVILIGNLGADPELKFLPSGQAVCELRLACNETWTDKGGQKQERVEWVRCVVWGKAAENCGKYLAKGKQVYVEGSLRTETWDDKETGQKRYATKVQVQSVKFLGGRGDGGQRSEDRPAPSAPSDGGGYSGSPPDFGPSDDDIPF